MAFIVGGNVVSCKSNLRKVVVSSTTEVGYVALAEPVKEVVWLKGLAEELSFPQDTVEVHCDSQINIALSKNSVHHERTKHVDFKFHFIKDLINKGQVKVVKILTVYNPAYIFTMGLPGYKFQEAFQKLRVSKNGSCLHSVKNACVQVYKFDSTKRYEVDHD